LTIARWAKLLLVPTVGSTIYFAQRSEWIVFAGIVLALVQLLAVMMGEAQRCPLCDASLVLRHERREEFATACPDCGFVID
jgi:hypothetical protein